MTACLEQSYAPSEVVVVADNCTDDTARIAREAGARVIVTSHGKKSKNLNEVVWTTDADVIIGIDADSYPESEMFAKMIADLDSGFDATSATVSPQQGTGIFPRSRKFSYAVTCTWWRWMQSQVGRMHCMSGCGWAVRTEALRHAGGVPTDLLSEARDMTWCLYASGARITYTPKAIVRTHEPETFKVYVAQMRRWSASFFQVAAKHRRELRKPSTLFITATALWDIVTVPVLYLLFLGYLAATRGVVVLTAWTLIQSLLSITVASRTIGWVEAFRCFPANKVVMVLDKGLYLWTFVREWILGRHYAAWTGRQGTPTRITPMSARRKAVFTIGISPLLRTVREARLATVASPAVVVDVTDGTMADQRRGS